MRKTIFWSALALIVLAFSFQSCSNDAEEETNPEFVATDSSFSNFMSWELEATNQGLDPALGTAHAGNDETVTRMIYFKNGQNPAGGTYPVGTIMVKHSKNPDLSVNEFAAMVKRGNNFNPGGGDWEWFMLNADGTIATDPASGLKMRGANLMNGMGVACHTAGFTDFSITK
ncbi:MAG: hypothetical protein AB7U05_11330 [Mangrovibacterium sp.]